MAESKEPEAGPEAPPLTDTGGAATAIALDGARHDPGLRDNIARFLERQEELIADQRRHLHEQLKDMHLRNFSEKLKVAFQIFGALAATAVALVILGMVWSASRDHGLVVEAFRVPPDFATRGQDGQALAAQVMDRIAEMDSGGYTIRNSATYADAWGNDIKVEIPETGVSIGELDRFLRERLGHQTRIGGEAMRTPAGPISLTVRTKGHAATTVTGPEAEMDRLVRTAAEAIYGATQPYQYSKYLEYNGRTVESLAVARALVANGPERERPWAWTQVCNLLGSAGDYQASRAAGLKAVAADPKNLLAHLNLSSVEEGLGHQPDAVREIRTMLRLVPTDRGVRPAILRYLKLSNEAYLAHQMGDYAAAAALGRQSGELANFQDLQSWLPLQLALESAGQHDFAQARALAPVDHQRQLELASQVAKIGYVALPDLMQARDLGDRAGAEAMAMRLADATAGDLKVRWALPLLARAKAEAGKAAEAAAIIRTTPLDCYPCLRIRGEIAAAAGRPAEADSWFGRAARMGSNMPLAEQDWGRVLLARGAPDAAIAQFKAAVGKSPRFADALEGWGEALLAKGDAKAAAEKFRQAAALSPRWGRLRLKWGQALAAQGKAADAMAQFRAAAAMDLSPADRAEVTRRGA